MGKGKALILQSGIKGFADTNPELTRLIQKLTECAVLQLDAQREYVYEVAHTYSKNPEQFLPISAFLMSSNPHPFCAKLANSLGEDYMIAALNYACDNIRLYHATGASMDEALNSYMATLSYTDQVPLNVCIPEGRFHLIDSRSQRFMVDEIGSAILLNPILRPFMFEQKKWESKSANKTMLKGVRFHRSKQQIWMIFIHLDIPTDNQFVHYLRTLSYAEANRNGQIIIGYDPTRIGMPYIVKENQIMEYMNSDVFYTIFKYRDFEKVTKSTLLEIIELWLQHMCSSDADTRRDLIKRIELTQMNINANTYARSLVKVKHYLDDLSKLIYLEDPFKIVYMTHSARAITEKGTSSVVKLLHSYLIRRLRHFAFDAKIRCVEAGEYPYGEPEVGGYNDALRIKSICEKAQERSGGKDNPENLLALASEIFPDRRIERML